MQIHLKILIALILSFLVGLSSNFITEGIVEKPQWFSFLSETCSFVGTLFLNGLKMVVIPLVMTSIICGVARIGGEKDFGRLGLKTLLFYSLTGLLAVITGLSCVNLFSPGIVEHENQTQILANQPEGENT